MYLDYVFSGLITGFFDLLAHETENVLNDWVKD